MRSTYTQLYVHCVWATWDRLPLITDELQKVLYAAIIRDCTAMKCTVIAIGGVADHVHLLLGHPPTLTVSKLMKQVKGSSSHLITHAVCPREFFKWQYAYGAFSISHHDLDAVAAYIRHQEEHHAHQSLYPHWELPVS